MAVHDDSSVTRVITAKQAWTSTLKRLAMAPWSSLGGYLPVANSQEPQRSYRPSSVLRFTRNGPSVALLAIALVSGLLGGFILSTSSRRLDFCPMPLDSPNGTPDTSHAPTHSPTIPSSQSEEIGLEALQAIVSKTRGYYARDYSMTLGWNNVGFTSASLVLNYHTSFIDALYYRNGPSPWCAAQPHCNCAIFRVRPRMRIQQVSSGLLFSLGFNLRHIL